MEVLIVDDEIVSAEILREALADSGYEVTLAENGRDALEILRNGTCRLVISDWEMPAMTGIELCRAVRAEDLQRYVYFILLTCRSGTSNVVEGLSAGADDFICKPFEPDELLVRLRAGERILSLETRDLAIFALARLAESRDSDTGEHLERVRTYCRVLGQTLADTGRFEGRIDAAFIRLLYQTSPLHDIGKVAIPDHVLLKAGRLDPDEFEIMKTHTERGAATLESALEQFPEADFLRMARDIAAYHHERYDGGGYPRGLAGEEIPLAARIFAVADVYDALVSKRIYKPAYTHDVAYHIIVDGRGTQFDPAVVDAFTSCAGTFREILENTRRPAEESEVSTCR